MEPLLYSMNSFPNPLSPSTLNFPGVSVSVMLAQRDVLSWHRGPKLGIASSSVQRAKAYLRKWIRRGRGRSLSRLIAELTSFLRGWVNYFRLSQVLKVFADPDPWIRRKLRCILWRQWKRPRTRVKKLIERGVERQRAFTSAFHGRGPWWNAGASHMNAAVPTKWFEQQGLLNLLPEYRRLHSLLRTAVCRTARTVV